MLAVSEGMLLGAKLGVEPKTLAQVFNASTARCWSSEVYNPSPGVMEGVPASRDYEGGFSHDLMLKDLSLALRAAADAGAPTPSGEHAMRLYTLSASSGMSTKDFGGVYQFLAKRAEGAGDKFSRDGTAQTVRRQFRAGDKEGDGSPRRPRSE